MLIIEANDEANGYLDRQPTANTIAYYPLTQESALLDKSGNNHNPTEQSGVSITTIGGISCAYVNGGYLKFDFNFITGNNPSTWSIWLNKNDSSSQEWSTIITTGYGTGNRARVLGFSYNKFFVGGRNNDYIINQEAPSGQWFNYIFTFDGTTGKVYYNGTLIGSKSMSYSVDSNNISGLFTQLIPLGDNTQYYRGYASKVIIENIAWSASECLEYFEKTKKKYGLS